MNEELSVSLSVLEEVAEREGVDPVDLPPLYDAIDTDALKSIVARPTTEHVAVRFSYAGYVVTVKTNDEPTVTVELTQSGENGIPSN